MFEQSFWHYSGIIFWGLIIGFILIRLIFGKKWPINAGTTFLFGSGLKKSLHQLVQEFRLKDIQDETLTNVAVHIFWRFTRLGIVGLLITGLPVWLLMQQNQLIDKQNEFINKQTVLLESQDKKFGTQNLLLENQNLLIEAQNIKFDRQMDLAEGQNKLTEDQNTLTKDQNLLITFQNHRIDSQLVIAYSQNNLLNTQNDRILVQNNLIEADRRSSLVFLMSNVLDKVDLEIKAQRDTIKNLADSTKYSLSEPLTARIVALSRAFQPYEMLRGDSLSGKLSSPERGQLFISLMQSSLDSATQNYIVENGDFSYAKIGNVDLRKSNLRFAKLYKSDLEHADLRGADLQEAFLVGANLEQAFLQDAYLTGAILGRTNLRAANMLRANLERAILIQANLRSAYLRWADMLRADLGEANLQMANFDNVRNLTLEQLLAVKSLFDYENLDPELEKQLREQKPCLFTEEGCPVD